MTCQYSKKKKKNKMKFQKSYLFLFLFFSLQSCQYFTGCGGFALSFNGYDGYVEVPAPQCEASNPFALTTLTYETWFYFYSYLNQYQWIMGQGGDYGLKIQRSDKTNDIGFGNANGIEECFSQYLCHDVPLREWYHVALSFNGSHFFLMCNGNLPAENIINCTGKGAPGKWDTKTNIGADHMQPHTRNTYGILDEMRIWKKYLSLDEINERRFRSLTQEERTDPDLVQYYTFDNGEGTILSDESSGELDGALGGSGANFREVYRPSWVASSLNITNGPCVRDAKFGVNIDFFIPVYRVENNYTIDLSQNFTTEQLILEITSIPNFGSLRNVNSNLKIVSVPFTVQNNHFVFSGNNVNNVDSSKTNFSYCLYQFPNKTLIICNSFVFQLTKNLEPFSGNPGNALWFDGIDDFLLADSFVWNAKNYSRGYGGGPVTIEWWGLVNDTDFQIDNLLAGGTSAFAIGSTEAHTNWCKQYCIGRFQVHAPWTDGYMSWDYGWNPGVTGRTTKNMVKYFNKWTHFAFVSDGKDGYFQGMYVDGEPFLVYNATLNDTNALPADGTLNSSFGLFIGCWSFHQICYRGAIDEFRVWNRTRTQQEIKDTMNKKITNTNNINGLITILMK